MDWCWGSPFLTVMNWFSTGQPALSPDGKKFCILYQIMPEQLARLIFLFRCFGQMEIIRALRTWTRNKYGTKEMFPLLMIRSCDFAFNVHVGTWWFGCIWMVAYDEKGFKGSGFNTWGQLLTVIRMIFHISLWRKTKRIFLLPNRPWR